MRDAERIYHIKINLYLIAEMGYSFPCNFHFFTWDTTCTNAQKPSQGSF